MNYKTKMQLVTEEVRAKIVDGRLPSGARLVLRQLAAEYDCSEIPVREALTVLASEGLVTIIPHGGARVSTMDVHEVVSLTEIRMLLEPYATCEAAKHLPDSELSKLKRILHDMEAAVAKDDAIKYGNLNRLFHDLILEHCPNRELAELIGNTRDRAERGKAVYRILPSHMDQSLEQHRNMLNLIRARDFTALGRVVDEHGRRVLEAVRQIARASDGLS